MKGKKIRSLLAVLLALILTFVGINPVVPEVKAEDLTSITWSDFNLTVGTTYTGATDESSASSNAGAYSAATNMNNTVFEGDVIMANGSEMRYGGNSYNQGFRMQVVDDAFVLTSGQTYIYPGNQSGSNEYVNESNGTLTVKVPKTRASEYGLKSFANEQFTLKIQMTGWDGNTGFSGMSLSVWINDVVVEENLSVASGSFGTYFCACVYGSVTPSPKLTKLTWSDFGLTVGQNYTGDTTESSASSNAGTYSGATNMNNTVFVGDIIMANGSEMRYGGNNYDQGFRMQVVDDAFVLTSGQTYIYPGNQSGSNEYVNESNGTLTVKVPKTRASEYGLKSFANEQFTLKIQMTGWDGNTGFSGMSLSVWINDVVVEQNLSVASGSFGTYFCACVYGSVTPSPKKISWEDFGFVLGQTYTGDTDESSASSNAGTYSAATNMNNTVFEGDVIMANGSEMRYGGNSYSQGFKIQVVDDAFVLTSGQTYIYPGNQSGSNEYVNESNGTLTVKVPKTRASEYGLKNFADEQFTLKIQMTGWDGNTGFSGMSLSVWINDVVVEENLSVASGSLGNYFCACTYGSVTPADPNRKLTEITWKDFTGAEYGKTYDTQQLLKYNGDSLNNTVFEDEIIFAAGSSLLYGVNNAWHGLEIGVTTDDQLWLQGASYTNAGNSLNEKYDASTFELTTLIETRITLRIEMRNVTDTYADVDVYINGIQAGDTIALTKVDLEAVAGIGINIVACPYNAGDRQPFTIPEKELTEITWKDFTGATYGKTYSNEGEGQLTYSGASLTETAFEDEIIFSAGSALMYAASSSSWHGIHMGVDANGTFFVKSAGYQLQENNYSFEYTCSPSTFDLDSLADVKLKLRVEMRDIGEDATTARFSVWLNDVEVCANVKVQRHSEPYNLLGNKIWLVAMGTDYSNSVTIPNNIPVPTGLTELSWEEFGYTGGVTYTDTVGRKALHLECLDGTLFNGDVKMAAGSIMYYGGDGWQGVKIKVNTDGTLLVDATGSATPYSVTANPKHYGLNSFADEKINLKIAITDKQDIGTNQYSEIVRVFVNDQIIGAAFTHTEWTGENGVLGVELVMNTESPSAITPYSMKTTAPSGLNEIGFKDWKEDVALDNKLENLEISGANPNIDTFLGTTLSEVVQFVGEDTTTRTHTFTYGGHKVSGSDYGIYIKINKSNMVIECSDAGVSFTLDPQKAGIGSSFTYTEFSWRIDTVQLGKNVLIYMSFNGVLYNSAPFVIYNFADTISNTIGYNSIETNDGTVAATYYTVLGASIKTLPVLYHDLTKGTYTIPGTVKRFYQRNQAGEWEEITNPATLTKTGDYKVEFNDGVSDYIQEVACYYYETDVDSTSLIRSLRMQENQEDAGWENHEIRLCDKNYDGEVDENDVRDIRAMLLDTYQADTDVMKISGFFSPTASLIEDATYAIIKETGVNHIIESDMGYSDDALDRYRVYSELSYAQKYGLTVTVRDQRLFTMGANGEEATVETVENAVANYKGYQSFKGLFIFDEPKASDYPNVGIWKGVDTVGSYSSVAKAIAATEYEGWSNAFGGDADLLYNGYNSAAGCYMRYGYYNYLQNMVDSYDLDFLSFTSYPLTVEGNGVKDNDEIPLFFMNLALAKKVAENNNIPLRTFVQSTASNENNVNSQFSEAHVKWMANIGLAFGAESLEYFTLVQAETLKTYTDGSCANGMVDKDGNKTKFADWSKSANTQVQAVDDILLNATNKGFMSTGGVATSSAVENIMSISMRKSLFTSEKITNDIHTSYEGATVSSNNTEYGAFTGCFEITGGEYSGKHAMYIVNFSDKGDNTVTVTLGDTVQSTTIYQGVEAEHTGTFSITLGAGEAVLVVY